MKTLKEMQAEFIKADLITGEELDKKVNNVIGAVEKSIQANFRKGSLYYSHTDLEKYVEVKNKVIYRLEEKGFSAYNGALGHNLLVCWETLPSTD